MKVSNQPAIIIIILIIIIIHAEIKVTLSQKCCAVTTNSYCVTYNHMSAVTATVTFSK